MKRFIDFLKENKLDRELDKFDENIFSIKEGIGLVKESEEITETADMSFSDIADANMEDDITEATENNAPTTFENVEKGFGDEIYVSLDNPKLMNNQLSEAKTKTRAEKSKDRPDSQTLKDLQAQQIDRDNQEDLGKLKDRLTNYFIADDGYTLLVKDGKTGERRPLTQDEVDTIVKRKNSANAYARKSYFDIGEDNIVVTVSKSDPSKRKVLSPRYRKNFLKKLNDVVNAEGIHYNWNGDTPELQVNATSWDDTDKRDGTRFDTIEYKPLTQEDRQKILSKVNDGESSEKKHTIGFENGHFTQDGQPMDDDTLAAFVKVLNGQIGGDSSLLNPSAWKEYDSEKYGNGKADYWESYKISIAGSKVGNAVNFNLPPVKTCHKGTLPCKKLCYAVKAYAVKPAVRGATECNFALLKRDKGFDLFKRSLIFALTSKDKNGNKFNLCRIHVSGDFYSKEYLQAICDVASACGDVNFWLYTKQYEILKEFGKGNVPGNLCIIVSCWGAYNPFDYKGESGDEDFTDLAKDYPLAYLDDESEEFNNINQKIQVALGKPKEIQYCPCTVAEQIITRCESCKICFDRTLASKNLVFKLH